jgi:uncharacterized SAM-binding protein YcdF (DUF218 family)
MDSAQGALKKRTRLCFRLLLRIAAALILLASATGLVIWLGAGKWLVREDPLQPATAIVILSGNIPARALEAAKLYHEGYANQIWLTHPDAHDDRLKDIGMSYPSEDDFNTIVLRGQGVPGRAIHVLDPPIINTAEELDVISTELRARGGQRVIIVTNKAHTRRVHILWTKYFGERGEAIAHGIPDDGYIANRWWTDPGSMTQVTHEILGILNAWAGLPIRRVLRPTPEAVAKEHVSADRIAPASENAGIAMSPPDPNTRPASNAHIKPTTAPF